MTKDKITEYLVEADQEPRVKRKLREIVQEIESNVPGSRTKDLMYDLVGMVLMNGERLQELEYRVLAANPVKDLQRREHMLGRQEEKGWQRVGLLESD